MKMPCKLCEKSIDQPKFGDLGCSHSHFAHFLNGSPQPSVHPIEFGLQATLPNNPFFQLPQLNMMLTAYLLRGSEYFECYFYFFY